MYRDVVKLGIICYNVTSLLPMELGGFLYLGEQVEGL